ncbi:hypothetical protein Tsubulata_019929 [Turnera subulata]|uniref:Transcription repressor n=1 Tax=Turnera subulata TaxID=218843 RepID=A0A9Q0J6F1_9ROSI|nr:hypothetical protein Tsubulata_019929 [Turnera subulata]
MSTIFFKNLLKCLPTTTTSHHPSPLKLEDHSSQPSPQPSSSTTAPSNTTVTSIMVKNFNSLYDLSSSSTSKSLISTTSMNSSTTSSSTSYDPDSDTDSSPPDFASIFASHRFFFSSPGRSNSIIETLDAPPAEYCKTPVSGGIAVKKYSPDPYSDFKLSMQEMIEARELRDVRGNWDYLHELLSCYLTLNPKHTHKFIISAFADIVICLLSASSSPESGNQWKSSGLRRDDLPSWLV